MKLVPIIAFLVSCILTLTKAYPAQVTFKKWAILLATSKGWPFYRHQANVLHAYHSLVANGFPKENIIIFAYDDIANNIKNPEKGVIRNNPNGPNVYKDVPLDYTGKNVTKEVFLAVLTGNQDAVKGVGSGRVVKSGRRDVLFLYTVGLGAPNQLTFPYGSGLTADVLTNTLNSLQKTRKTRKILWYVELSYAASLVQTLPRKNGIMAVVATGPNEVPRAVFCYKQRTICYGNIFGVAWTEHLDRLRQLRSGARETLFNQFQYIRTHTVGSHVSIYGHIEMGRGKAKEFFSHKYVPKNITANGGNSRLNFATNRFDRENEIEDSDDVEFEGDFDDIEHEDEVNERQIKFNEQTNSNLQPMRLKKREIANDNYDIPLLPVEDELTGIDLKIRTIMDETFDEVVKELSSRTEVDLPNDVATMKTIKSQHLDCYHQSVENFHKICFDVNENTYALRHLHKLANMCALSLDSEIIAKAMESVCTNVHRNSIGVH